MRTPARAARANAASIFLFGEEGRSISLGQQLRQSDQVEEQQLHCLKLKI